MSKIFYFRPAIYSRVPYHAFGAPLQWNVARNAICRAYGCNLAETIVQAKREASDDWLDEDDIIQEGETVITTRRHRFKRKRTLHAVCKSIADEEDEQTLPFLVVRERRERLRLPSSFADWAPAFPSKLPEPAPEEPLVIPVGFTAEDMLLPESKPAPQDVRAASKPEPRRSARIAARQTKRARQ